MSDNNWPHYWLRSAVYMRDDMPHYGVLEVYEGGYLPVRLNARNVPCDVWVSGDGAVFEPTLERAWTRLAKIQQAEGGAAHPAAESEA